MKRFIAILASVLFISQLNAQFTYGPRLGLNLSKMSFSNEAFTTGFRPGLMAGAFGNYQINEKFAIQAELFYSMEGTTEKNTESGSKGKIAEGFLHLPVLAQYSVTPELFVEAGPQVGFLLSSKEQFGNSGWNSIKQYYNTTTIRVPVGVGYDFSKSAMKGLRADLRYHFDLSALNKVEVGGSKLRNHVIALGFQLAL